MDYDCVVVGAGPAGLAAAIDLAEAKFRVLVLDSESFGGPILNIEWIDGYPAPGKRISGAMLASEFVNRAERAGVELQLGRVGEIEAYSGCVSVSRTDGGAHTCSVLILAGGLRAKKLGIPGEDSFEGRGMIHCAMCDAGLYRGRVVAVCGAGNAGLIEAEFLARFCSKVIVLEAQARPTAEASLQEAVIANPRIELRCETTPVEVVGDSGVTGLVIRNPGGNTETLDLYGVLVHVGYEPHTDFLQGVIQLDASGHAVVDERSETSLAGVFAAGDLRSGAPRTVAASIADGKVAARSAAELLRA